MLSHLSCRINQLMKNNKKKVKFVVFYDHPQNKKENRGYPLSAATVVDYIISILTENNMEIEIVSPVTTRNIGKWYPSKKIKIDKNVTLTLGPTLGLKNIYLNKLLICFTRAWICMYLIKNISAGDVVFVWHQIPLMGIIQVLRSMPVGKKIKLIYSVGELYQRVLPQKISRHRKRLEFDIINNADAYILSTQLLNKYLNIATKPQCVLHGAMTLNAKKRPPECQASDGIIHIIYSGVINETKGAFLAVEIARYLTAKYCIHVLGWATEDIYLQKLRNAIEESNKLYNCKVEFNGVLVGEEYHNFVRKCHIGLCTQEVDTDYNDCSFPSKIMTYLCDGLVVISTRVEAVVQSQVKDMLYFVDGCTSNAFADAILSINSIPNLDRYKEWLRLNDRFKSELLSMIRDLERK